MPQQQQSIWREFIRWGPQVFFQRKAYDFVPIGVRGRPQYPATDVGTLLDNYTKNEIVYAAINRKATAAIGPRMFVEKRSSNGDWKEVMGHPFRRLVMRPNPRMDEAAFLKAMIVSMDVAGVFYAEKVFGSNGLPEALYPLNPAKIRPILGDTDVVNYEFKDGGYLELIPPERMLVKRMYDPRNRFQGLSPLAVCMGSVDADNAQTDFIREFFNNAGVPSGLLKIKGRKLSEGEADNIRGKWYARFGRRWGRMHDISVLDEDAEYQKVGAALNELASQDIRSFTESRVAMTFDVPPLIIYAYVGLLRSTYSNLREAWAGFWDASLTPMFRDWASFLTWSLLVDFVGEDLIYGEQIRLNWDFSQVTWLQEDVDKMQARARENFARGGLTLNEFRSKIGEQPDKAGEYYLRQFNLVAQAANVEPPIDTAPARELPPAGKVRLLSAPMKLLVVSNQKAARATVEGRINRGMKSLLSEQYQSAADALEARKAA